MFIKNLHKQVFIQDFYSKNASFSRFVVFFHLIWAVMYKITQQQRLFKCYFSAPLPPKSVIRVKGGQHRLLICVTSDSEGKLRIRRALIKGPARYFENWGEHSPVTVQIPHWSLEIRAPSEAFLIKSVYYTMTEWELPVLFCNHHLLISSKYLRCHKVIRKLLFQGIYTHASFEHLTIVNYPGYHNQQLQWFQTYASR